MYTCIATDVHVISLSDTKILHVALNQYFTHIAPNASTFIMLKFMHYFYFDFKNKNDLPPCKTCGEISDYLA